MGFRSLTELQELFPIDKAICEVTENYNVAPSQEVLAIVKIGGLNILEKLHWGLVPSWAKDTSVGNKMINARIETLASKPSYRNAFKNRRCLIIADGFYEWKGAKGKKEPVYITLPDKKPFCFAGLWEIRRSKELFYKSCTIITTEASESIRPVHHRMPAILKPEKYEYWLNPLNHGTDELMKILYHDIFTEFTCQAVSKQVNSVKNNKSSNIIPLPGFE